MHLILTGATGLVGNGVLDAMIKMKAVTKITIISRKPVKRAEDAKDPRINVIIHKDFENYDKALLDQVKDAEGCVWALGISQTQVGKQEYIKITKDYALAAAKAFQTLPSTPEKKDAPFNFVFVSGEGTTQTPGYFTSLFARVKGETETLLSEMRRANPRFRVSSMRPGFVDPYGHGDILPYIPPMGIFKHGGMAVLGPVVRATLKGHWSPTEPLGRFLTEMAMGRHAGEFRQGVEGVDMLGEMPVVENPVMRRVENLVK